MKESITNLLKLQELDNKLNAIERAKGDLPEQVKRTEAEVDDARVKLTETEKEYKELVAERRKIENEVADLTEARKKYEDQLYAVKTNREYDAVTTEIENTVAKIDENENLEIELLDKEKAAKNSVEEQTEALKKLEKRCADHSEKLQATIASNADREKALKDEREAVSKNVRKDFLRLYERIRIPKGGIAVTPIHRGACGGCYTQMPPQRIMEVRDADRLFVCEHCGRILYWAEEEEITIN